jgi:hypothetical protein
MVNSNRNRRNQPPSVVGKHQPRQRQSKLSKRSEVVQAARNHPELNLGTSEGEAGAPGPARRPKAGR